MADTILEPYNLGDAALAARKKLGEILLEAGLVDRFQLKAALAEQAKHGGRLGSHLMQMGILTEDLLVRGISKQLQIPNLDLSRLEVTPQLIEVVPQELAERYHLVPAALRTVGGNRVLIVAMSDPTNTDAQEELQFRTGLMVKAAVASESAIERCIRRYYYGEGDARADVVPEPAQRKAGVRAEELLGQLGKPAAPDGASIFPSEEEGGVLELTPSEITPVDLELSQHFKPGGFTNPTPTDAWSFAPPGTGPAPDNHEAVSISDFISGDAAPIKGSDYQPDYNDPLQIIPGDTDEGRVLRSLARLLLERGLITKEELLAALKSG